MAKKILSLLLLMVLFIGAPQIASASPSIEIIENEESVLHVTGASGLVLFVYNVTGVQVMTIKVDGADKSYNLNLPKGCYIVKVGKVVRKVSIR